MVDNSDGSYSVSYTPKEPGTYSVWVCVKAQHVKVQNQLTVCHNKIYQCREVIFEFVFLKTVAISYILHIVKYELGLGCGVSMSSQHAASGLLTS